MDTALGSFLVSVVLIFIGVFVMFAAYSRNPLLLKIAALGLVRIDPDNPGRKQRAVIFAIGVMLILVGVVLIALDKLKSLGII